MPAQSQDSQKAKSPSKVVQSGVDKSWGQQQKATTSPQEALQNKNTKNPVKP